MKKIQVSLLILFLAMIFTGCEQQIVKPDSGEKTVSDVSASVSSDDLQSIDTAVIVGLDSDNKKLAFQTTGSGNRYELEYDGTTDFRDEYGKIMTAEEMEPGDIVDITLSVHSKKLKKLIKNANSFSIRSVTKHEFLTNKGLASIDGDNYRLPSRLVVVQEGKIGEIKNIKDDDVLTVRGIDRTILSVSIESGQGYVKLIGEKAFVGGWLAIDQIIKPITDEGVVVAVPEGEHELSISYHGYGGVKNIQVKRGEQSLVDVSDLEDIILKKGEVNFKIDPSAAELRVDGEKVVHLLSQELLYGIHKITVTCPGYISRNSYIKVGQEKSEFIITLKKEDDVSGNKADYPSESTEGSIDYIVPRTTAIRSRYISSSETSSSENKDSSTSSSIMSEASEDTEESSEGHEGEYEDDDDEDDDDD